MNQDTNTKDGQMDNILCAMFDVITQPCHVIQNLMDMLFSFRFRLDNSLYLSELNTWLRFLWKIHNFDVVFIVDVTFIKKIVQEEVMCRFVPNFGHDR